MLVIAIPKSASTSLMKTIAKIHRIPNEQYTSLNENKIPDESNVLHEFHSDVRELEKKDIVRFSDRKKLNKQHIFPSENNIKLLKDVKKVVLLREPKNVVLAYKRGMKKKVHNQLNGLDSDLTDKRFLDASKKIGLLNDLEMFYSKWESTNDEDKNLKIIYYKDLINEPKEVINEVEEFFEIELSNDDITLLKERYSRRNKVVNFFYLIIWKFKKIFYHLKVS